MALPSSGTISLLQIQQEFGVSSLASMAGRQVNKGGSAVTIGSSPKVTDFLNTSNAAVGAIVPSLPSMSLTKYITGSGGVTARVIVYSDGRYYGDIQAPLVVRTDGDWYTPRKTGVGSSYWGRMRYTGSNPVQDFATGDDPMDTWISLGSTRMWTKNISRSTAGATTRTYTLIFEIASDAAGSNIVSTGNIFVDLSVEI